MEEGTDEPQADEGVARDKYSKGGEDLEHILIILQTFELGSWQEATFRVGKGPTTTNWADRTNRE